jgi:tetratricopeptide (TPR) repeat protein
VDTGGAPASRSAYSEAIAAYEQAMRRLQERDFAQAAGELRRILQAYPDEKELAERVRVYLALCERHLAPPDAAPQSLEEHVYAATLAFNAGELDRAIGHLERVVERDGAHDRALYLLATAYAQRGEPGLAIPYLQRAVEANPENRALARTDPDLEALRGDRTVAALLEPPVGPDGRRGPARPRFLR